MIVIIRILILGFLSHTIACSQTKNIFDVNESYKGFIVKNDVDIFVDDKKEWFIPSLEEVRKAEKLLSEQVKEINKEADSQGSKECPIIDKNLNKYIRQYIGYVNMDGDKIIFMNLMWEGTVEYEGLDSEYNLIFDGCSRYWKIKVNLTSQKIYDLEVNGSA